MIECSTSMMDGMKELQFILMGRRNPQETGSEINAET